MFASVSQCAEPISQPCPQGHRSRSWVWALNFMSAPYLYTLEGFSLNFGHMFASVRLCAEPITHLCWLEIKVTIEGHQFEPWILRPLHCHSAAGDIAVLQSALFTVYYDVGSPPWYDLQSLTLVLLNPDMPFLCKQCRSRSVGFWTGSALFAIKYVNL